MVLTEIDHLTDEMADCMDNCLDATQACEWCADACAEEGEGMARCIRLCRDVADITTLHARFMARDSGYHGDLAAVCADACEECADECENHDRDHCQLCADVLRDCAASCREMASA
ncbi:MAG: four-helix bundle copper-binding protein [Euryarchaeota archaeon]|nr:four-helix bundle copper-binding protein [Euryarchaeota archaeon]